MSLFETLKRGPTPWSEKFLNATVPLFSVQNLKLAILKKSTKAN
jgi:hypothetical protein